MTPRPFLPAAPIDSLWDIFQWNSGTVPNYGTAGNCEAGGFVNSTVNLTKLVKAGHNQL